MHAVSSIDQNPSLGRLVGVNVNSGTPRSGYRKTPVDVQLGLLTQSALFFRSGVQWAWPLDAGWLVDFTRARYSAGAGTQSTARLPPQQYRAEIPTDRVDPFFFFAKPRLPTEREFKLGSPAAACLDAPSSDPHWPPWVTFLCARDDRRPIAAC